MVTQITLPEFLVAAAQIVTKFWEKKKKKCSQTKQKPPN